MSDIYDHLDYQAWLREAWEERRTSDRVFSLRYAAQKTGIDHSLLVKILQGKRHLTDRNIPVMAKLMGLDSPREKYLGLMVAYAKAKTDEQIRYAFEKLSASRPHSRERLEAAHYEYFQSWRHVAIRSLLDWYEFRGENWEELGRMLLPPVSGKIAKESVDLLERLELLSRDPDGRYRPSQAHVSTGERWHSAAVRAFQKEVIGLSQGAVDRVPRERRDISTLTVALSGKCLEEIRTVLKEARSQIIKIADRLPPEESDMVYQLNLQFFPVTRLPADPK